MKMDIITYSETLLERLGQIDTDSKEHHDLTRLARAVSHVSEIIHELKIFTSSYVFADAGEEIRFFKEIKPVLLSQYYFYKKLFALRLHDSFNDPRGRTAHYHLVLGKLQRYAQKNKAFYEYCMSASAYLDTTYFLRGGNNHFGIQRDESFSTGFDTKLSKMLAYELLKKSIMETLRLLEHGKENSLSGGLTWTDSKVALVELIYALHATGVINNGRSDIKRLITSFEDLFSVELGNYSRVLAEIRIRKSGQTVFIDSLKERFLEFIATR